MQISRINRGKFVATGIILVMLVFFINTGFQAYAQKEQQRKHEIKEEESFQRPEPTRPVQPEVPNVNRYQEDKVFLEYADSLYKRQTGRYDTIERQILKGNVKFRQSGLWMYCDSAYYYPEANSLDAFSNVKMEQGDTLFVYADQLFYDGDEKLAKLKNGPTRDKVTLINKDVTLTTDSLDYDLEIDLGWYVKWGTIYDKVNTLTSLYGEYSPKTKRAEFFTDVVLVNEKDGYTMYTDTLYYNTETHIANIDSRTVIQSENDTIITSLATYYTDTGDVDLLSRSLLIHKDSTGNVTTLEGDSIIYDNATRISRAYMFRDPFKRSNPMVITDTAQKTTLIGGFGIYNDSTKEALATIYPLLMEYSQGDTLFLRADTILTFMVTDYIPKPKPRSKSGFPEYNDSIIAMKDTLSGKLWIDTTFFSPVIPFRFNIDEMMETALLPFKKFPKGTVFNKIDQGTSEGKEVSEDNDKEKNGVLYSEGETDLIEIVGADEVIDEIEIIELEGEKRQPEEESSEEAENDDVGEDDELNLESLEFTLLPDSVIYPPFTVIIGELEEEVLPEEEPFNPDDYIAKEFHVVLAYHRGRFFKQDMQGIADSIVFVERDSMLYLFRKPIVWSEERQVTGNRIDVHFNDSTTDWAYLPEFGLISELVDEDFYNQIYGKEITAYFENQGLRRMSVSGNVETIFLPQESDSTYNRLVNAESSYMEAYLDSNKLDWLKMWPEVSGTVTPIFLVKRTQMYLQKFKWWGFLRPQREWYGDRIRWADNLGEVPEELDQYFMTPSDFGEPKSFGTGVTLRPSSLPIWRDEPEMRESLDSLESIGLINPEDSLYMKEPLDSIGNIEIPDSLGVDSAGVIDAEMKDTIEGALQENREEENEAAETEKESNDIEEEVNANDDSIIKEEEPEIVSEDSVSDTEEEE